MLVTAEEIAAMLRAKGFDVGVVQDSILINIKAEGGTVATDGELAELLKEVRKAHEVDVIFASPPCEPLAKGFKLFPYQEHAFRLLTERGHPIVKLAEPYLEPPKNQPFYRRMERRGKKW